MQYCIQYSRMRFSVIKYPVNIGENEFSGARDGVVDEEFVRGLSVGVAYTVFVLRDVSAVAGSVVRIRCLQDALSVRWHRHLDGVVEEIVEPNRVVFFS